VKDSGDEAWTVSTGRQFQSMRRCPAPGYRYWPRPKLYVGAYIDKVNAYAIQQAIGRY